MSAAESLTQKWLRQNAHPYPQKDRVYVDVDNALARFPSLRPKSDVYTYDDGRTQLLLCVHGLLPIKYRQASYNIPIAVWLTKEYPKQPPIAYVVPTNDMLVKAGKFVDISGRCSVEYLHHWQRKPEACNLSSLLEALQDQFSREPPVYAKPKNKPASAPQVPLETTRDDTGRLSPAIPSASPSTQRSGNARPDRPIVPPRPGSLASPLATAVPQSPSPGMLPSQSSSLVNRPPPPLPQSTRAPPVPNTRHESPAPPKPPPPPDYRHPGVVLGPNIAQANAWTTASGISPVGDPRTGSSPPPFRSYPTQPQHIYHPPPLAVLQQPYTQPPDSGRYRLPPAPNLLDEETSDAQTSTLPQSSSAPPPPRPPNPELVRLHAQVHQKLQSELGLLSRGFTIDADRQRSQQTGLLAGQPAILDEMARLEAVRDVCRNVAGRMRSVVEQGERNITELKRKGDPEVDELVCSTSIVHNQLINLVAEDNAIEDTIYHLHRALNTGRIDLERFLRTTRVLAEEQFMKRALIEKIHMGLPADNGMAGWH